MLASTFTLQVVGIDLMTAFLTEADRKASEYGVSDRCDFRGLDGFELVSEEHDFDLVVLASVGGIFGSFENTVGQLRTQARPSRRMLIDDGDLKEASTTEVSLRIGDEYQRLIEKRGRELMATHPELSADIAADIDGQAEECRVIADHQEGAVWLLRREP